LVLPASGVYQSPFFSVIVACHNAERSITTAIESVFQQTCQSFEVIVVDDESADSSGARVMPYAADGRLRLYSLDENVGLANAMNRGLLAARGHVVVQLDADDWLLPNALAQLQRRFLSEVDTPDAVYGAPLLAGADGRLTQDPIAEVNESSGHLSYPNLQAPRAYRRSVMLRAGGWPTLDAFQGRFFEDRWMLSRIHDSGPVQSHEDALYVATIRPNSLSRKSPATAAAAKLGVLLLEATRRRMRLEHEWSRGHLRGEFRALPQPEGSVAVSVIIPFERNLKILAISLAGWRSADLPNDRHEIIVVRYGREDPRQVVRECGISSVKVVDAAPGSNAAAARNTGEQHAKHDVLHFADADHIPHPDTFRIHMRALEEGRQLVLGGGLGLRALGVTDSGIERWDRKRLLRTVVVDSQRLDTVARLWATGGEKSVLTSERPWEDAWRWAFVPNWQRAWLYRYLEYDADIQNDPHRWLRVGGAAMTLRRDQFRSLGCFDETFDTMEDWDLGAKAQAMGLRFGLVLEAEPVHLLHKRDPCRPELNTSSAIRIRGKHWPLVRDLIETTPSRRPPGASLIVDDKQATNYSPAPPPTIDDDVFALTFDDGPDTHGTSRVLEALRKYEAPATFFVLGQNCVAEPDLLKRIVAEGHEIGVHAWQHVRLTDLKPDRVRHSIHTTVDVIEKTVGVRPRYFRPPFGYTSDVISQIAQDGGLQSIGWHTSVRDWSGDFCLESGKAAVAAAPIRGSIILLHDTCAAVEAVAQLVEWILGACESTALRPALLSPFIQHVGSRACEQLLRFVE